MNRVEDWVPFSWHCVNCGNIVTGFRNSRGDIKVECKRCQTAMIRTLKTPKHDIIMLSFVGADSSRYALQYGVRFQNS